MASNDIKVKYTVDDNGTLKSTEKKAKDAAKATENLANSSDRASKAQDRQSRSGQNLYNNQRGIINGSLAAGRANAKLSSGITGGLVPAYAALASTVFAVTAFFGAFQKAASLKQLEEGLIATGEAAGRNLPVVAKGLQEITGYAISTREAMEATAIAFSAGFSTSQLSRLTKVADGASKALGRDLTDSLTRLVRGTAKLEPEILDELGIMVRLDDASRAYAVSLNKTVGELTRFERTQAFLNETLAQGEQKFGGVVESVDANPFNKLSASFIDLKDNLLAFFAVAVTPFIEFLSQNDAALIGVLVLLGSTITKQLSTPLKEAAALSSALAAKTAVSAQKAAAKVSSAFTTQLNKVNSLMTKTLPAGFEKKFGQAFASGKLSAEEMNAAVKTLNNSEKARLRNITKLENEIKKLEATSKGEESAALQASRKKLAAKQAEIAEVQQLRAEIQLLSAAEKTRGTVDFKSVNLRGASASTKAFSNSLAEIDRADTTLGRFKAALRGTNRQWKIFNIRVGMAQKGLKGYQKGLAITQAGIAAATRSVRLFGAALMNSLPVIGQLIFFGSMLYDAFSWMWEDSELEKGTKELVESFKAIEGTASNLNKVMKNEDASIAEKTNAVYQSRVGLIDQLSAGLLKLEETSAEQTASNLEGPIKKLAKERALLEQRTKEYQEQGFSEERIKYLTEFYADRVAKAEEKVQQIRDKGSEADKEAVNEAINGWMARVTSSEALSNALSQEISQVAALQAQFNADTYDGDISKFSKDLENITEPSRKALAAVDELTEGFASATRERLKFTRGQRTEFDPFIDQIQTISNAINVLFEDAEKRQNSFFGFSRRNLISKKQLKDANNLLDSFKEGLEKVGFNVDESDDLNTSLRKGLLVMRQQTEIMQTSASAAKKLTQEAKNYGVFAKDNAGFAKLQLETENKAINEKIKGKEAELALLKTLQAEELRAINAQLKSAEEQGMSAEAIAKLEIDRNAILAKQEGLKNDINTLNSQLNTEAKITYETTVAQIEAEKEVLDLTKKILDFSVKNNELKQKEIRSNLELQRSLTGGGLTAQDEYNLTVSANNEKRKAEEERLKLQKQGIDLEYRLLRAKIAFENARLTEMKTEENASAKTIAAANAAIAANATVLDLIIQSEEAAQNLADEESRVNQVLWKNADALALEKSRRQDIALTLQEQETRLDRISKLSSEGAETAYSLLVNLQKRAQIEADLAAAQKNLTDTGKGLQRVRELQIQLEQNITFELETQLGLTEKIISVQSAFASNVASALLTTSKLNKEMAELANTNPFTGEPVSLARAFEINEKERQERLAIAELEATIKKQTIAAEFNLLKAKFQLLKAEFARADSDGGTTISPAEQAVINANQQILDQQETLNGLTIANIDKEFELLKAKTDYERIREAVTTAEKAAIAGSQIVGDGQGGGILAATEVAIAMRQLKKPDEKTGEIASTIENIFGKNNEKVNIEDISKATLNEITKLPSRLGEQLKTIAPEIASSIEKSNKELANKVSSVVSDLKVITLTAEKLVVNSTGGLPPQPQPSLSTIETPVQAPSAVIDVTVPETPTAVDTAKVESASNPISDQNLQKYYETSAQEITPTFTPPTIEMPSLPEQPIITFSEGLMQARLLAQGFAADIQNLGPEGQAISAFIGGGLALTDSLTSMMDAFDAASTKQEQTAAVLSGLGSAIGAIGQIQQASSAQAIAAIDQEIEAERRRDGKSTESVNKIKALEAKKEQTKRKAFEQDKKMKMAQVAINTAASVAANVAAASNAAAAAGIAAPAVFAGTLGILNGITIALGAAQMALIASTSYQGGGSIGNASSTPAKISVGARENTVDLARANNASGELAYARGESGVGSGMTNYTPTPAFTGMKYRANGGNTAFMVGEQGPELFMPDRPGTIMPSDETEQMTSAPINVNFSIQALDSQSVQDMLLVQRANIIGMIREAANGSGEAFLESVNIDADQYQMVER